MTLYNIGLLFNDKFFIKSVCDYSQYLKSCYKTSKYEVNNIDSLPHCTVLQFYSELEPEVIWEKIKKYSLDSIFIDFYGITFKNDWVQLSVFCNEKLRDFQEILILSLKDLDLKYVNGTDKYYEPHLTLGYFVENIKPITLNDFQYRNVKSSYLTLGVSGDFYQYKDRLY